MNELNSIRSRMVEAAGRATQSLGMGRAIGQVFAHLYFSRIPQTLDDLTRELGISKGSASMVVRQLEQWSAARKLWIRGDRKDYYEACDGFGKIIRKVLRDQIGETLATAGDLLDDAESGLQGRDKNNKADAEDREFLRQRLQKLKAFKDRTQRLWDSSILAMLLKS